MLHLNGTVDWMVAQRKALLAWTGHTLQVTPTINRRMSLAYWGNSEITGRGLVALAGRADDARVLIQCGAQLEKSMHGLEACGLVFLPESATVWLFGIFS